MPKKSTFILRIALMAGVALLLAALSSRAGMLEQSGGDLTLEGFGHKRDEGSLSSRLEEYRDLEGSGIALGRLYLWRMNGARGGWRAEASRLGRRDAEASLHAMFGAAIMLDLRYSKIPHRLGASMDSSRERAGLTLSLNRWRPDRVGVAVAYETDDKAGAKNSAPIDRQWSRTSISVGSNLGGNAYLGARAFETQYSEFTGGHDASGVDIQLAASNEGRASAVAIYRKTDFDPDDRNLTPKSLEASHAGFWGRYNLFDYFQLSGSVTRAEADNRNSAGRRLETTRSKLGAALKLQRSRVGFEYEKKTLDKTNGLTDRNESDSFEAFLNGRFGRTLQLRLSQKSVEKNVGGARTTKLPGLDDLPSDKAETRVSLAWQPTPALSLSTGAVSILEEFRQGPAGFYGVSDRRMDTQSQSAVWSASKRVTATGEYFRQRADNVGALLDYDGAGALITVPGDLSETLARFALGVQYLPDFGGEISLGYDQSRSSTGGVSIRDRQTERNVELSYARVLAGGLEAKAAYVRNHYFASFDAYHSGVSDLLKIEFEKSLKF